MTQQAQGSKKSRKQRREDRRAQLKQAAIEVFSERGYHGAKVSDIVERVGVAQGTFYLYYEGKQQLFGELLDDFLTLVVEAVSNWEPSSIDTRATLRAELIRVGMMLTEVLNHHRGLTSIFFKEALAVAQEFDDTIHEFYDTLGAMLTHFNEILCQRGLIEPMNFRILAFVTIGQVERIIAEYVVNQTLEDVELHELVEHLVVLFLSGTREPIEAPSTHASPDPTTEE